VPKLALGALLFTGEIMGNREAHDLGHRPGMLGGKLFQPRVLLRVEPDGSLDVGYLQTNLLAGRLVGSETVLQ
jgi:hypothetical protein